MRIIKIGLCVALLFLLNLSQAQKAETLFSRIQIGMDYSSFMMKVKPPLWRGSDFSEKVESSVDLSLQAGTYFKGQWFIEAGLSYEKVKSFIRKKNIIPVLKDAEKFSYQLSLDNSLYSFDATFQLLANDADCLESIPLDRSEVTMEFDALNWRQALGIPIAVGRVFGKKQLQFFAEFAVRPSFIFKKTLNHVNGYAGLGFSVKGPRGICEALHRTHYYRLRMVDLEQSEPVIHLEDFRVDGKISLGLIHTYRKSLFKMALFYGESISPFSKVQGKKYFAQMGGVKIGFRRVHFRKKE